MAYIAKQMIGKFKTGEEVTGLTAKRIKELVEDGAIEGVADKPKAAPKRTAKTDRDEG